MVNKGFPQIKAAKPRRSLVLASAGCGR